MHPCHDRLLHSLPFRLCPAPQGEGKFTDGVEDGIETSHEDVVVQFFHELRTTVEQIIVVVLEGDAATATGHELVESDTIQ